VKGGGAVVGDKYGVFGATGSPAVGTLLASTSETRWGGAVGIGLEIGFAPSWSLGVEYDHLFFGHRTLSFTDPTGAFLQSDNIGQNVDMGLVRLNYRFSGPLVAKY
jgi:outer membrane immunogenic protein